MLEFEMLVEIFEHSG